MLEKVVVNGSKPRTFPTFGEWQLLTKAGQTAFLSKRYPGARAPGSDPLTETVPNYAAVMMRDDARHEMIQKLEDVSVLYRLSRDPDGDERLKREIQRSFIRRSDWRTEGMDKSYNNGRR